MELWIQIALVIIAAITSVFHIRACLSKIAVNKTKYIVAVDEMKNKFIKNRLLPFLYESVNQIAEFNLPRSLKSGDKDWESHLNDFKEEIIEMAYNKFNMEEKDIKDEFGEDYIDQLAEQSVVKAIPFLPHAIHDKEISDSYSAIVIEKGLTHARHKCWLAE